MEEKWVFFIETLFSPDAEMPGTRLSTGMLFVLRILVRPILLKFLTRTSHTQQADFCHT